MTQLIYVCDTAELEQAKAAVDNLRNLYPAVTLLEAGNSSSNQQALESIKASGAEIILVQASAGLTSAQIKDFIESTQAVSASEVLIADYQVDGQTITFPDLDISDLITWMSSETAWPIGVVRCGNEATEVILRMTSATSASAVLAATIVNSIAHHHELHRAENAIALESKQLCAFSLDSQSLAQLIRYTLEAINIEELFPNHPWEQFTEESAAACYHTLAALFFKLNDTETAVECINYSQGLEDSPRALALKGLIAYQQGETLAAVANMVSSLQEYEKRKKQSEEHYISFAPKNLEIINDNLQSGLSALNKRDNNLAVGHFAKAVFEFDNFFEQCGISEPLPAE